MISVEEFLALKPDHADDDENALMIARIEHERAERESLEQKRMELLKRKQKLIADNKKRKDDLANLDKELEKFIDVCVLPFRGMRTWTNPLRLPNLFKSYLRRTSLHKNHFRNKPAHRYLTRHTACEVGHAGCHGTLTQRMLRPIAGSEISTEDECARQSISEFWSN